jgi:DNA-binding MarR family transcriptional regulator
VLSQVTNEEIRALINTFEKFTKADWHRQPIFGIKRSEMKVLLQIKDISLHGEQRVTTTEISKSLMVTSPTVTQMIKSLHQNGFVERSVDTHDRRVTDIQLTAKGEEVVQLARKRRIALYTGLIETLGKKKKEQLISLLDEVYDYLDKVNKE